MLVRRALGLVHICLGTFIDSRFHGPPEKSWVLRARQQNFPKRCGFSVRRELGLTFVIAMARHRLQREPFVGMTRAQVRALRDARGLADRRALEPSLSDQWVYDFYRHQAPGGRGDGPARGG